MAGRSVSAARLDKHYYLKGKMFRLFFKGRNLNNFHFTNDPALTVTGKETTATSSLSLNKGGTRVDDDLLDFAISRTKFL